MHDARVYRRAGILIASCLALAAIASSDALHEALIHALLATQAVIGTHAIVGMAVFVFIAAVCAMFAFVSIAVIVPAAVFSWGLPATVGLLWLGWILGGVATYSIGKFFGRPVVRWLAAEESLRKLEARLPNDAPLRLVVLLQLALPSEIPGYVLGLLRYPLARYVMALGLAELPYALATAHVGANFIAGRSGLIVGAGALIALLSVTALFALRGATQAAVGPAECPTARSRMRNRARHRSGERFTAARRIDHP